MALIKICGLCSALDAQAALDAGADLIGFIFVPGTKRFVEAGERDFIRELAGRGTVGVFRNQPLDEIFAVAETLGLDRVQLHGDEPDEWLDHLGPQTLRAQSPGSAIDWQRLTELAERCLPLIDPGGGSGESFDWSLLANGPSGLGFGLAGGLGPGNVAAAIATTGAELVDVSSGIESRIRVKDHAALRVFITEARTAFWEKESK